eukprot:CAMPEP_0177603448 /NCGR_PEP_ID=MMETSP0419_2-20121207/15519_1 /TAXON_ID=582737 /ORGANISM="Tetraselmis sp., Strain GSL018" /LENGTH=553 /DNA_ID=CAMNT_0019097223 /DNA_START=871 /DNA_END=2532 /DNA_ORIENTATION=+
MKHIEGDPVDRLLEQRLMTELKQNPPPKPSKSRSRIGGTGGGPSPEPEQDLLSSVMRRLGKAEQELKAKAKDLAASNLERDALRQRVAELERGKEEASRAREEAHRAREPASEAEAVSQLRAENLRLREQNDRAWGEVARLKEFLSDYGLVWVGDRGGRPSGSSGGSSDSEARAEEGPEEAAASPAPRDGSAGPRRQRRRWPAAVSVPSASLSVPDEEWSHPRASSEASPKAVLPIDVEELERAIADLNDIAGDGRCDVVRGHQGEARLRAPEAIPIAVFANGIQLHSHKFRRFEEKGCQSIIGDIMDGYFPSVLKHEFPDGVPLQLVDRSGELCPEGFRPFQGPGKVLAERAGPSAAHAGGAATLGGSGAAAARHIRSMEDLKRGAPAPPQSADRFLGKLPQSVVRNGRLIDIRSDIEGILKPSKEDIPESVVKTNDFNQGKQTDATTLVPGDAAVGADCGRAPASEDRITTLRVKREDGAHFYCVELRFDDTIGDLRSALDLHRRNDPDRKAGGYEIWSAFPKRHYDNATETLKDAGLVPNASLLLRPNGM